MEEEYLKSFLAGLHCGFCGQQCLPANIDLVQREGDYWVFSVFCDSCNKRGFVTAVLNKGEEPEIDPELTEQEIDMFCTPVSSDDILDMHNFLKDFGGDFSELFPDIIPADTGTPQPQPEP